VACVFLFRHGETALNKKTGASSERIRGWVDVPLDDKGKREAVALGAEYANSGATRIYTSDFQRATIPAMQIAKGIASTGRQVPLIKAKELRPWNLGILHGKEVDKVIDLMNKCIENPDVVIPQGESFDSYRMRYLPFLAGLLRQAESSSGPILAVTHSRNIQLARAWDKGGRKPDFSFDLQRMNDYRDEVPPGGHVELKP